MIQIKTLFFSILTLVTLGISQAFAQENCLPSCVEDDGKTLQLVPFNVDHGTLSGEPLRVEIITEAAQLDLGIFDSDHSGTWDKGVAPSNVVVYRIYADGGRAGNSAGLGAPIIEMFSTDAEAVDNDWREIVRPHDNRAFDGNTYNYLFEAVFQDGAAVPAGLRTVQTAFKLRAEGDVLVLPNNIIGIMGAFGDDHPVAIESPTRGIIYPDFSSCQAAPQGEPPFSNCTMCNSLVTCIDPTTYDGNMSLNILVQPKPGEIVNELVLWDGDLDLGDGPIITGPHPQGTINGVPVVCPDPPLQTPPVPPLPECGYGRDDTDDPDTPNVIPSFNLSPFTVAESASPNGIPRDDNPLLLFRREGPVAYQLVSPDGDIYINENPSGTEEWERFTLRLNNHPGGCNNTGAAPEANADYCADSIPAGVWTVNVLGLELENIAFFRVEFTSMRLPGDSIAIPTLTKWGMIIMTLLFGIFTFLMLRKRKV